MSTLVLSYFNRLSFLTADYNFLLFPKLNTRVVLSSTEEHSYANAVVACSCCGWKGKIAQTQKKYLFVNFISEIEYFCPDCTAYIGFVADKE